jgi:hypothetical protein
MPRKLRARDRRGLHAAHEDVADRLHCDLTPIELSLAPCPCGTRARDHLLRRAYEYEC